VNEERTLHGRTVLVTGGAGFIGSHLVDRIVRDDPARVVIVDNLWLGRQENLADALRRRPDTALHIVDASNNTAMGRICGETRFDVVFALATIPLPASHVRPRWAAERIVKMTTVLAELARQRSFDALVHCSSSEVYGTATAVPMSEDHPLAPTTPYAAAKAAADLIVLSYHRTFDIDVSVVRPFNNYGTRQNSRDHAGIVPRTLQRIRAGRPPVIFGDGEQTRDYIFATDTAEALVRAYERPATRGRVVNVASGTEIRIKDLVRTLCELAGWTGEVEHRPARPADVRRHRGDTSLARELLGFEPRTDLASGLRETVEWYLASPERLARDARSHGLARP